MVLGGGQGEYLGAGRMVCGCFFLASSLPAHVKVQEGKRGQNSLVKAGLLNTIITK